MSDQQFTFIEPTPPDWEFCFTGDWRYRFCTVGAPNRFHRWMQRVFLGIHWRRINLAERG